MTNLTIARIRVASFPGMPEYPFRQHTASKAIDKATASALHWLQLAALSVVGAVDPRRPTHQGVRMFIQLPSGSCSC